MPRPKFTVGERVEVQCYHLREGQLVHDWLPGTVVQADARMVAVRFRVDVYTNYGWPMPARILRSAPGSPRIRRPESS